MLNTASFQTRARAIDHLGRGQIADAPTAISELWKNAYDAYARGVELHIHSGNVVVASICDNGHGMDAETLSSKWLVVGTESKVASPVPVEDRFGLPERARLGEKGIGRLSAAFLSPVTLVVSKRVGQPYAALLVDWRFFENPYLFINDVRFPLVEFGELKEFPALFAQMFEELKANLQWGSASPHTAHLAAAWDRFDAIEREQNPNAPTTREAILSLSPEGLIKWDHFSPWWQLMHKAVEGDDVHGTALFTIDANTELACWVTDDEYESPDAQRVKKNLHETLVSFVDPFEAPPIAFDYAVVVHKPGKADFIPISAGEAFDIQQLRALEHIIEGEFDSAGNFRGRITAFSKDRGECFVPSSSVFTQRGKDCVGPFKICLGTFEQIRSNTTHSDEKFEQLATLVNIYGGICIHRDGLRVMPYGREDGDIFNIEERRNKHAGREFFSYRRMFGHVAITSKNNPNLKDKAGREGLVVNKARREFERLVIDLLMYVAREYFGTASSIRAQELPGIQKARQRQMRAAETARKRNQKNFFRALKEKLPLALEASTRAEAGAGKLEQTLACKAYDDLPAIKMELDALQGLRDDLRIPNRPDELGSQEKDYRTYRDAYAFFCATIDKLKSMLARCEAEGLLGDPKRIATSKFYSNEARISSQIGKALSTITSSLDALRTTWEENAREDRTAYRRKSTEFVSMLEAGQGLTPVLDYLDKVHTELSDELNLKYDGIIHSLEQLVEGVDLEGAFFHVDEVNRSLEEKVSMLNSVAQLGISVEIIGHELEALESQVTQFLKGLPKEVRVLKSYTLAFEAHRALIDRLRFLAPLRKTSYRSRIAISGKEIAKYVQKFFGATFDRCRIQFEVTPAFEGFSIRDLPSRIYPTFINLVNNALYWVQRGDRRIIRLDFVQGKAIVADSGPGVDEDDQKHLFELFFTKRHNGRGVGLYLCRENLAVARHSIRYATANDPEVLEGANFIIEFNEVEHVSR